MKPIELKKKYGNGSARYSALLTRRTSHEGVWRDCARLTLPYVFPEENTSGLDFRPTPYNSVGPKAVNALSSKLLLALLPPTGNFFRLLPYQEEMDKLGTEEKRQVDKELSQLERDINERISIQALRVPLNEALKSLVVTGNSLVYKIPDGTFKVFSPYSYVVQRDYSGEVMEIVIKERIAKRILPKDVRDQIDTDVSSSSNNASKPEDEIDIFTIVARTSEDSWTAWQEAGEVIIESSVVEYKTATMPYLALRWTSVPNEDYGRGLVEQVLGDLRSLEGVTQMLMEGTGVMAKTVFGLKPASSTKLEDLNNAANGDIISGDLEGDLTVLKVDKSADFQIPYKLLNDLTNSIGQAFLVFSSTVRDSERTTAVEVRATQAELESVLGGTYSVLAQDLQLPLLRLELDEINSDVLKLVTPSIVAGVSAISRERDLQNLNYMAQALAQFGDVGLQYFNVSGFITSMATALGIPPELVVKSQEQMQAEQQQQAQMQQQQAMQQQAQGG